MCTVLAKCCGRLFTRIHIYFYQEDLNTLYGDFDKMGEGDDVWWVDEDDVLGPGTKPPPAYPDKQQSTGMSRNSAIIWGFWL